MALIEDLIEWVEASSLRLMFLAVGKGTQMWAIIYKIFFPYIVVSFLFGKMTWSAFVNSKSKKQNKDYKKRSDFYR